MYQRRIFNSLGNESLNTFAICNPLPTLKSAVWPVSGITV